MKTRNTLVAVLLPVIAALFLSCAAPRGGQHVAATEEIRFQRAASLLSENDKGEILSVAHPIPKRTERILWIEVYSKSEVDVYTGEVRGPLDGGGPVFKLRKLQDRWRLMDDGPVSVWMS